MKVDLGCNVLVLGLEMKNSHNSLMDDFSAKNVKVEMVQWSDVSIYHILHQKNLPDSRGKVY